jgi:UTP--glucose-1-phosphate uridylyltransferase
MNQEAFDTAFSPYVDKLRNAGSSKLNNAAFRRSFGMLLQGESGKLTKHDIGPVASVPSLDELPASDHHSKALLKKVAVIKLNGGLGTSMGLERAKSLIELRDGLSFLDIIARQIQHMNRSSEVDIPLIFMNSQATHDDTLAAMKDYEDIQTDIPFAFLQNMVPKIDADSLQPADWPSHPSLEWCPPGHGDIYISLLSSGLLDILDERGYKYLFISNADNLGAVLDDRILKFIDDQKLPFLMEVAKRTAADRKGGHLALGSEGNLTLRELAQCPEDEQDAFQDVDLYSYFNTNSLWIHVAALKELLTRHSGVLPLPMIRNEKNVDPRDSNSPKVIQLETAMGSAISLFEGSQALLVPRSRFAPVKTTDDLLAVRSDAYILSEEMQVVPNPERSLAVPDVSLDRTLYARIDDLDSAFSSGTPSMKHCRSLEIKGKFIFGKDVILNGDVRLNNSGNDTIVVPDGTIFDNAT